MIHHEGTIVKSLPHAMSTFKVKIWSSYQVSSLFNDIAQVKDHLEKRKEACQEDQEYAAKEKEDLEAWKKEEARKQVCEGRTDPEWYHVNHISATAESCKVHFGTESRLSLYLAQSPEIVW